MTLRTVRKGRSQRGFRTWRKVRRRRNGIGCGDDDALSGSALRIPHRESGVSSARRPSAALKSKYVLDGNFPFDRQFETAESALPVRVPTAFVPPRASITALVVSSGVVPMPPINSEILKVQATNTIYMNFPLYERL
jgi:hypothetical protein